MGRLSFYVSFNIESVGNSGWTENLLIKKNSYQEIVYSTGKFFYCVLSLEFALYCVSFFGKKI